MLLPLTALVTVDLRSQLQMIGVNTRSITLATVTGMAVARTAGIIVAMSPMTSSQKRVGYAPASQKRGKCCTNVRELRRTFRSDQIHPITILIL